MFDECQLIKLKTGIALFNQKEFFEAHEFFEELWQEAEEEQNRAQFLFLVRLAAAGVHLLNENYSCLFLYQLAYQQITEDELSIDFLNTDNLAWDLYNLIVLLQKSSRNQLQKIGAELNFDLSIVN